MTIRCKYLFKSDEGTITRDGKGDRSELLVLCTGTSSRAAAHAAVILAIPDPNPTDNCDLQSVSLERLAKLAWVARCEYGVTEPLDTGEFSIAFDLTGATAHMTAGYATRAYDENGVMAAADIPDGDLILVDQDGRAAGVDVPSPSLKFTLTYRQPRTLITLAYARILRGLVGKVNSSSFAGFDAYEVMFLGASGRQGTKTDPSIDYHFYAEENIQNLALKGALGAITVTLKRGHEFLHPVLGTYLSNDNEHLETGIRAYKVSEVVKPAAFGAMQLLNVPGGGP